MLAAEKQNKSPALAGRRKCPHFSPDEKYLQKIFNKYRQYIDK
jgi:hypothetical protein